MPAPCDECGRDFNLTHFFDCHKGGLVTQQHIEVRDALGDLDVVCDVNPDTDTDVVSYVNHSVPAALTSAEKKCKLLSDAESRHTSFTPLLYLLMGHLVMRIYFLQHLADWISGSWGKSCGYVLMWIN